MNAGRLSSWARRLWSSPVTTCARATESTRSLVSSQRAMSSAASSGKSGAPWPSASARFAMLNEPVMASPSPTSIGTEGRTPRAVRQRSPSSPIRGVCSRERWATRWWANAQRAFSVQPE